MKQITRVEHTIPSVQRKKRVAAYARVSKSTERLMHSVSAQVSYYSDLIQSNPEWEFVGVYTDYGITGTAAHGRSEFLRLVSDCEAGKIDLVLTKSISRFARNTVDMLETVRRLKELGVEVFFEKERISSLSGDGELMLTILASFAQEEARSISENIKWRVRKGYENGFIPAINKKIFGYRYDGEKYVIQEDEAEIVRYAFTSIANGIAPNQILKYIHAKNIKTCRGYEFSYGSLYTLLNNEMYTGDRRAQKCFIGDPLKHNKVKNIGQIPQYYISGCNEPIIEKELFYKVQEILKQRAEAVPIYPFSKKIVCGVCGRFYSRNRQTCKGYIYVKWVCRAKKEVGLSCSSINLDEKELMKISAQMTELDEFDETVFEEKVKLITVEKNGDLKYEFTDGSTKVWKRPVQEAKPPKPQKVKPDKPKQERPKHLFDGKIFCGTCGRRFGRCISQTNDGGHIYWRCRAKSSSGTTCDSVNYSDSEIRNIFCRVMGKQEFDDDYFRQTIERITIYKTGSIDFLLKSGEVKNFKTFKNRVNVHKTTDTDEFEGKIVCASCGNIYHKYRCQGKYVYWHCSGKHKVGVECHAQDYTDYNLRCISAFIMDCEEFDGKRFKTEIDHITVLENGSLEYAFNDGRKKIWERM